MRVTPPAIVNPTDSQPPSGCGHGARTPRRPPYSRPTPSNGPPTRRAVRVFPRSNSTPMPDSKPITITLAYCGCPNGAWRATAPRHNLVVNHDDPRHAVDQLVRQILEADDEAGAA